MIEFHDVSEDDCRRAAVEAIDNLIRLRELPDEWQLADEIGNWLFLLGEKNVPGSSDLVGMNLAGLRNLRDRIASPEPRTCDTSCGAPLNNPTCCCEMLKESVPDIDC